MSESPQYDRERLRALLTATDRDPVELIEEIRRERVAQRENATPRSRADLASLEFRFLWKQAERSLDREFEDAAATAKREWLAFQGRSLVDAPEDAVEVVFELAELEATLRADGDEAAAAGVAAEIERRIASLEVGERLEQEARERYVALSTDEESVPLALRIETLRSTAKVMRSLSERSGNKTLKRLSRRLWRASCDHELARRLERVLTRRGAVILETTSLALLVVLFALLAIEVLLPISPAVSAGFTLIDAGICVFFISEFFFKLSLAPARTSWFLRNALTDLLPALPAALLLLNVPNVPAGDEAVVVRALRFLRIAYFARYVQALRPLLRVARLLLFMVRGLDHLVRRFAPLINRNFVFFEAAAATSSSSDPEDLRLSLFRAMRREHILLADLPRAEREPLLKERCRVLVEELLATDTVPRRRFAELHGGRDVPVEKVIETLHAIDPDELGLWLTSADIQALDRVARVINAPVVRSIPFVRRLRSPKLAETAEERVVELGKRVADRLERWRDRALFFADMHGILTGPQILDRVATAMINASKRPAVRLLLFGGLFLIVRAAVGEEGAIGEFLKRFVATPLLVLGSVCLVFLWLGRWLKRLAGEAAENLKRTAEAHFIGLLELQKNRGEDQDTAFLAKRVFRWELKPEEAQWALCRQVAQIRDGAVGHGEVPPGPIREDINRVALLYLHFLDGAILHENDVKTSEQLLANLSLENIRSDHLDFSQRDRKRLRKLSLGEGATITGPYLWFRCITESVALETAKRVIYYNRHCLTLRRYGQVDAAMRGHMDTWLEHRQAAMAGRLVERFEPPEMGASFVTTEFNALDFLSPDPIRESHVRSIFGDRVVDLLRMDREHMVREIFGTRRLDRLPRSRRVVNFYALYMQRLSRGRILLIPVYWVMLIGRLVGMAVGKTVEIVREILAPERATQRQQSGRAGFSVALRKIHRMKAPGLLEAMATRASFDPAYCGTSIGWTEQASVDELPELEQDMDFLQMKEHERESLRELARLMRRRVESCHFAVREVEGLNEPDELERRLAERAVTIAFATDRSGMRTLFEAEEWFERIAIELDDPEHEPPIALVRRFVRFALRGFRAHPVTVWLREHHGGRTVTRRVRRNLALAYYRSEDDTRRIVDAWAALPAGVRPKDRAEDLLRSVYRSHDEISRELAALRAVQSLSVLDVRNYRRLVFNLGGFAADGECPDLAEVLP